MINYLKGAITSLIKTPNNRLILILEVNNIGYEIQVPARLAKQFSSKTEATTQIFTHLQSREDQQILYGFSSAAERDLFRQLINVNGVGAQLGIALIDTLSLEDLVQAIIKGNTKKLIKTPGVGVKTAERIALELKTKLAQWRTEAGINLVSDGAILAPEILEEVEMTLLALGYTPTEINQAIATLSQDSNLLKNTNGEDWIRNAIAILS